MRVKGELQEGAVNRTENNSQPLQTTLHVAILVGKKPNTQCPSLSLFSHTHTNHLEGFPLETEGVVGQDPGQFVQVLTPRSGRPIAASRRDPPATCPREACGLRMILTFLKSWGDQKEIGACDMQKLLNVTCQPPGAALLGSTDTLVGLLIVCGCRSKARVCGALLAFHCCSGTASDSQAAETQQHCKCHLQLCGLSF